MTRLALTLTGNDIQTLGDYQVFYSMLKFRNIMLQWYHQMPKKPLIIQRGIICLKRKSFQTAPQAAVCIMGVMSSPFSTSKGTKQGPFISFIICLSNGTFGGDVQIQLLLVAGIQTKKTNTQDFPVCRPCPFIIEQSHILRLHCSDNK